MPLCVDGHVMTALTTWLSPVSEGLARVARYNLYAIGAASVITQSAYHGVVTWQATHSEALTAIATGAGAFPPIVATAAAHIAVTCVREVVAVIGASAQQPMRSQMPEATQLPLLATASTAASEIQPSPEAVSELPAPLAPIPARPLSTGLSAVPPLSAAPKPAAASSRLSAPQPSPSRRVTVDEVRPLAHLERSEIAAQLGVSVATVDRRLRELRNRQAVTA